MKGCPKQVNQMQNRLMEKSPQWEKCWVLGNMEKRAKEEKLTGLLNNETAQERQKYGES